MEVEVRVPGQVSTDYDFLLASFQVDYQAATGQVLLRSDIKEGLAYRKTFGAKGDQSVAIRLHRLVENELYEVFIRSNRGMQLLAYRLKEESDQKVLLTYQEDFVPEGRWQMLNYRLLFPLMKKTLEKRMFLHVTQFAESAQQKGGSTNG